MELDRVMRNRHSVKKFSSRKPDWKHIIEAIDAARYAPTAGGNYTLKFILVSDSEKINQITEACQQHFVAQAHYVVVACSLPGRLKNAYGKQGEVYARQQAGAAIENFLLKIEDFGLSTCWGGYFVESQIKRALKIPEEANVEAVFPIGFEYEKPRTRKVKIDLDNILYFNSYGQKERSPPKAMNV